jgi:hypothetical protein
MSRHDTWEEAHEAALKLARLLNRETGILRQQEFGRDGYNVYSLPRPENRCGFELRCEIVRPTDPSTKLKGTN